MRYEVATINELASAQTLDKTDKQMEYTWIRFDKGNSIGQIGSEGGLILKDEENTFGARVTLEGKGDIAPFSITIGIYGVMFHTEFFSTVDHGQRCFELYKEKIEMVVSHHSVSEDNRDAKWNKRQDQLIDEILKIA